MRKIYIYGDIHLLAVPHSYPLVLISVCTRRMLSLSSTSMCTCGAEGFFLTCLCRGLEISRRSHTQEYPLANDRWELENKYPSSLPPNVRDWGAFYSFPKFPGGIAPLSCYQLPPIVTCTFTLPSLALFPSLFNFPTTSSVFTGTTPQINSSHFNLALGQLLREPKLTQEVSSPTASLSVCPRLCLHRKNGC